MLYILWNPSEIAAQLGPITFRWYGLCWLIGIVAAYFIVKWLYSDQKIKDSLFDPLLPYCFVGILLGARLGHCLFYEPSYFLSSPTHFAEMFLPFHKLADGTWKYTGYAGLASHGGTLGLMIALYLYCRHTKVNIWTVLDNIAIATPTTACAIRIGNLMNSEIIGKPTDLPWAFIFQQVDNVPRHPGQLYEALAYLALSFVMFAFYFRSKKTAQNPTTQPNTPAPKTVGSGFFFGLVLTLIFTSRFFIEFTKDIQVDFESQMALNMGQLLSIPFVILGIATMIGGKWMKKVPGAK